MTAMLRFWFNSFRYEDGIRYFRKEDVYFENFFYMLNALCESKEITENILMFLMLLKEIV